MTGIYAAFDRDPARDSPVHCSCPCLDCIEGLHCGGTYYDDETRAIVGVCHEITADELLDHYHESSHMEEPYPDVS